MNTISNRRFVWIVRLTAVASLVSVIGAGTASAAIASEPRWEKVATDSTTNGSFGEPLAALDGRSLAQYLDDHWANVLVVRV